jgi:polyisoprenoid-binding protein YceI
MKRLPPATMLSPAQTAYGWKRGSPAVAANISGSPAAVMPKAVVTSPAHSSASFTVTRPTRSGPSAAGGMSRIEAASLTHSDPARMPRDAQIPAQSAGIRSGAICRTACGLPSLR